MLYLFDLDGTLISGYMDNPDKDYNKWAVLPGRVEKIAALRTAGHRVGVVTNQAGVAFGHIVERDFHNKWEAVARQLGFPDPWAVPLAVCYCHPQAESVYYQGQRPARLGNTECGYNEIDRRKPSGLMIRELMAEKPAAAAAGVLFVGDRPEDAQAAADAGVPFQWAHEFFGA